jgi:hypothetical protein
MILNPEFHRYLWINFSPFKLWAMPTVLALLFVIFADSGMQNWQAGLTMPAFYLFIFVVIIWGNYEAASASDADVSNNTWDFQKMSPMSPWQLLIGKLFGSTSFVWFTGAMILAVFIFSYPYSIQMPGYEKMQDAFPEPIKPIIYMILSALAGHATSFYAGLSKMKAKKSQSTTNSIFGLAISIMFLSTLVGFEFDGALVRENKYIIWHRFEIGIHSFLLLSLLYVLFWIIIAAQRQIRIELQYRNSPFVYVAFVVSLCVYLSGLLGLSFSKNLNIENILNASIAKLYFSYLIMLFSFYGSAIIDSQDLARYKRFLLALRLKNKKQIILNCPSWLALLPFALVCYFFTAGYYFVKIETGFNTAGLFILAWTCFPLFIIRDGLFWHVMMLGGAVRNVMFKISLYYLLLYALMPYFMISFIHKDYAKIGLSFFYPFGDISLNIITCVVLILESITLGFLLKIKLQNVQKTANP